MGIKFCYGLGIALISASYNIPISKGGGGLLIGGLVLLFLGSIGSWK